MIFAKSYKILNPKGVCYIKSDFNEVDILSLPTSITKGFKYKIKEWLYQSIDIVSVETKRTFWHLKKGALGNRLANIVEYVPNGFDEELCKEYDMKRVSFSSKENLIITVGRIGSKQKANEVMFDALDQVDMKNWKFVLIGPIEEDFKIKYNIFIERNPDKKIRLFYSVVLVIRDDSGNGIIKLKFLYLLLYMKDFQMFFLRHCILEIILLLRN